MKHPDYSHVVILMVYGMPGPQGSKRHVGKGVMIESSKKVKPWREDVGNAARAYIADSHQIFPLDLPLALRMVFTWPKPLSAPKKRKSWPMRKPDLSKLIRSTEDALVTSGLIKDDSRIVEYDRAAKVYPGEDHEALQSPGVRIEIRLLTAIQLNLDLQTVKETSC